MKLQIWPDAGLDQGGEDLFVAGVVYPANSEESDMAFTLWKNIYQQKNHDDRIEPSGRMLRRLLKKYFLFFVTFRERKSIYYKGVIKWTSI